MFGPNLHIKKYSCFIFPFFLMVLLFPFLSAGQTKEVVALEGEGIYRLLTRNGLPVTKYMDAFIELNKEKLGKDNILFAGVKYKLPESASPATSGSNARTATYAEVEISSNELDGAVYYLMAGHGGPDPGAVGNYNNRMLTEDEYAYDVTLRLARKLIEKGALVYMITRDKDDAIRDEH